ncbi:MAG: histidinol-phosphate transaminase [Fimbriimonadaceae bacterium]|nr:histidinol-phosphate transaminase [Fimbriimonadaceae bacterium]
MAINVRPAVTRMTPYSPGKPVEEVRRELGLERVVKLASNENPLGPSPKAIEAVERAAETMHLYPDASAHDLNAALGYHLRLAPERIVIGNGSDELIHLLGLVLLENESDELVMGDPSFVRYEASAQLANARLVKVPLDEDFRHDLPAMAKAVTERTRLVYIANPNNPTGTIVRRDEFERFLGDLPTDVLVVLDEAYYEYAAGADGYPSSLDYVHANRNVFGMRTFSKAYGLAGIRVGYGFGPPEVVDAIHRAREPFNVNSLAQAAAIAALGDREHLARTVATNRAGLERLGLLMRSLGASVVESYGNFAFVDLGRPAEPVFEALLRKGVIVRAGRHIGHPDCLRVTVGTDEELDFFEEAIREALAPSVFV